MVRLRNEGNTSTLFEFGGNTKVLAAGSLSPSFNVKMQRNQRLDAKDVLHKKGVDNLVFNFSVVLSGVDRFTNADVIIALAAAQTTIISILRVLRIRIMASMILLDSSSRILIKGLVWSLCRFSWWKMQIRRGDMLWLC